MTYGAGCILYPNMKSKLEAIIGDFIIIPSSIHEVLIFPNIDNKDMLRTIIKEVNSTAVSPDEVLSGDVLKLNDNRELIAS